MEKAYQVQGGAPPKPPLGAHSTSRGPIQEVRNGHFNFPILKVLATRRSKTYQKACQKCSNCPTTNESTIDPNGDLDVEVGTNRCIISPDQATHEHSQASIFQVDSRSLARGSKVFSKMLYGGFAESKQPADTNQEFWTVCLPDDNPVFMELLFHIMHINVEKLPENDHP